MERSMKAKLLWVTPNPLQAIEYAARTCYDSHDKTKEGSAAKLIKACLNKGHNSIIEHASASFKVEGVSRALLAQLSRHRFISLSVRSQRYCGEDGFDYVVPDTLGSTQSEYHYLMNCIEACYKELVASGVPKEDARMILPNACHTEFVMTANFRTWYEFLPKRLDRAAQWEIRELAEQVKALLSKCCPEVFEG